MKINLTSDKDGYAKNKNKQTKTQRKLQKKHNFIKVETQIDKNIKFQDYTLTKHQSPSKITQSLSPTQRYYKKVFNKDYSLKKIQCSSPTNQQNSSSKKFVHSSKNLHNIQNGIPQFNIIQQQQNESSSNNFSLGLFTKSQAPNSSFFQTKNSPNKKSIQRKLDFNKIFIFSQQQSPFKQIIQLSVRQRQNKDMLQKAVQQLQKRKLQKKYKILKKNMKLNLRQNKDNQEQSIQELRSHRIGYKTFYKKQIFTARCQSEQRATANNKNDLFKTPQKPLVEGNKNQQQEMNINQCRLQKIHDISSIDNNIILQDENHITNRRRIHTNVDITQGSLYNPRYQYNTTNLKNSKQGLIKGVTFKLPLINKSQNKLKRQVSLDKKVNINENTSQQKDLHKSLTSLMHFSALIKHPQNHSLSLNTLKPHKILIKQNQNQLLENQLQKGLVLGRNNSHNQEFPFLLSKQDLQMTLNKSRYQAKKLLCMHIQKRQKQWKKMKKQMLSKQDKFSLHQQIKVEVRNEKSIDTIIEQQKQQQDDMKKSKLQSLSFRQQIRVPPNHMLKVHTRQLKKSIKQFVGLMNDKRLSPKNKQHLRIKFN